MSEFKPRKRIRTTSMSARYAPYEINAGPFKPHLLNMYTVCAVMRQCLDAMVAEVDHVTTMADVIIINEAMRCDVASRGMQTGKSRKNVCTMCQRKVHCFMSIPFQVMWCKPCQRDYREVAVAHARGDSFHGVLKPWRVAGGSIKERVQAIAVVGICCSCCPRRQCPCKGSCRGSS